MSESIFRNVLIIWILIAVAVFISLFFITAPYGRYFRLNSRLSIDGMYGWIIMEAPASLIFAACFITNIQIVTITQIVLLIMWQIHYLDRSFIYPVKRRISSKPLPLAILVAGFIFNSVNAYLNGMYTVLNASIYSIEWLTDVRFLTGLSLFFIGFIINRYSDLILYRIRSLSQEEYIIPYGGLFRWVSSPNYLGEILIWIGWTIATWSPVAAAFSLWTIANLAPRARAHHKWYQQQFDNYPEQRHALIPWLW
jgi:3-oxo-5-alpha-steroid 4-dehydrogenase 1